MKKETTGLQDKRLYEQEFLEKTRGLTSKAQHKNSAESMTEGKEEKHLKGRDSVFRMWKIEKLKTGH